MITLVDVRLDHPRGGSPIVTDANLAVSPGEVAMIVGAAGVGTTRLLKAALGEVPPNFGRIDVLGHDVGKLRRSSLRLIRRRIGVVPQDLCLLDDRSAQLNVAMPLEIDGIPRAISMSRAEHCLARLGLESEASVAVDNLAWSARQRVAVARALVREPELIIADHPTSMQDAEGAELVCGALAASAAAGAAVVVLGRDPAMRVIAEREGWRMLGLVAGMLRPLDEIALEGKTIEELIVEQMSAPVPIRVAPPPPPPENVPNLVPFPITARTAGGAA